MTQHQERYEECLMTQLPYHLLLQTVYDNNCITVMEILIF